MELVTHPLDQNIIVSTGSDTTIMFWSLDPKNSKQPCALICAGEGHRETILSIVFIKILTFIFVYVWLIYLARHFMQRVATFFQVGWIIRLTW
jgi:hypothetical protein